MVSFATLLALLGLMVLGALVFNAGQTVTRKIETQNAADSVAYSSSVWIARGLNAVTAANHMMGELNALYVVHHSFGGKWLDEHAHSQKYNDSSLRTLNTAIDTAYVAAQVALTVRPSDAARNKVRENPCSSPDSTVYQAKSQLKTALAISFGVHAAGGALEKVIPWGVIPGQILQGVALIAELKCYQEYLVLDGVEMLAQGSKTIVHGLVGVTAQGQTSTGVLDGVARYADTVVQIGVPAQVQRCATAVAREHGATGAARGDIPGGLSARSLAEIVPTLPVEPHEHLGPRRAQLMRAGYPWVCRWRTPIRKFFKLSCTISGAAGEFTRFTNLYSEESVKWLQTPSGQTYRGYSRSNNNDPRYRITFGSGSGYGMGRTGKGVRMLVLKGLNETEPRRNGFHKSMEAWNKRRGSTEVERLFVHMGFAHTKPATIGAPAIFRQENPDGFVCFSQSMVYNANPQQAPARSGADGGAQPTAGWDTLNWTSGPPEFVTDSDLGDDPKIVLNWQAKLTPVTPRKLTATTITSLAGEMSGPLRRSLLGITLNNH